MVRIQRHNMGDDVLPSPVWPRLIDGLGPTIYAVVATIFIRGWKEKGSPGVHALIFFSSTTMFWQEWYADWGAYLHWNKELTLMPWGSTLWTTPNKPWYVIVTYGLFYSSILSGGYEGFKWTRKQKPDWGYWSTMFWTVMLPFYLWNWATADMFAFYTYHFHYLYVIGPGLDTSRGSLPLLYPAFPFCTFGPFVVWTLDNRDARGRTWFERWFGAGGTAKTTHGQIRQLIAWCIGLNIMYSISLTIPLVAIRVLFLPTSTVVP
jgi:hypothetical protein